MSKLLIFGAGDQGLVTLDCALAMKKYSKIDFLAFKEREPRYFSDYSVYKEEEENLAEFVKSYDEVIVASGSNDLREEKILMLMALNVKLATIIHPTAVISLFASLSQGCTVLANVVININAQIGIGCIINTGAIVEHDCVIEDFVNVCPGVYMAGHTKIGRKSFLGIGCNIINEITIGKEVIVGAGATVIRNIADGMTAVGVPAIPKKQNLRE